MNTTSREKAIATIMNNIADEEYFLSHIFIGIQKKSEENIIKKPVSEMAEIEKYIYLCQELETDETASAKLNTKQIFPFSETEMWERAEANTFEKTTVKSMFEVLCGIYGAPDEIIPEFPIYIISNEIGVRGASSILDKKALKEFGKKYNTTKILALPSSIHEFIIAPYDESMDIAMFTQMVQEVNSGEVSPDEQLSDRAYILNI